MKVTKLIGCVVAMAAAALSSFTAQAAKISIAADSTYELTDSVNVSGNTLAFAGAATLKLTGGVTDGAFELKAAVLFEGSGTVTVDISALSGCTKVLSRRHVRDNGLGGSLAFPAGVTEFRLGSTARGATNLSWPSFEAEATFAEAGGKVVFENDATVIRLPSVWDAEDGARLALFGSNVLGAGDYTLTDFDVRIGSVDAFASGATVTVPTGRTLSVRICSLKSTPVDGNLSTWQGIDKANIPVNVCLDGGVFALGNNTTHTISGDVTGSGAVDLGCGSDTVLGGNMAFVGHYVLDTSSSNEPKITIRRTSGTAFADFDLSTLRSPTIRLEPAGAGSEAVTAVVQNFEAHGHASYPTRLMAAAKETISLGMLTGNVCLGGDDDGAAIVIDSVASGSVIWIEPGVEVTVRAAAADAQVLFKEKNGRKDWKFNGPATGDALAPLFAFEAEGGELTVGGKVDSSVTLPVAGLTLQEGAELTAVVAAGAKIVNHGGILKTRSWREKALLWVDATVGDSFLYAKESLPKQLTLTEEQIGYINANMKDDQVSDWLDCRAEGTRRLRHTRFDPPDGDTIGSAAGFFTPFPAVKEQDGLPSLYFTKDATRTRIYAATGVGGKSAMSVKCAIFAFNGALGGGNALFAGPANTFERVASRPSAIGGYATIESPIVLTNKKNLMFRKNGTAVDCTRTGLDAGWQVLAFTSETAVSISAIGPYNAESANINATSGNGGQIFGELLVFEEVPAQDEILEMEKYLADKWAVQIAHAGPTTTTTCEMFGNGSVRLDANTQVGGGNFAGLIDLNGKRLTIPSKEFPFTEAEIPATGRILWADPSLDGATVVGEVSAKPDEMTYLKTRDNSGLLSEDGAGILFSPYSETADRRVRVVSSARGDGPVLPWLDFENFYAGDTVGNFLYFATLPYQPMADYTDKTPAVSVLKIKSGFFAIDSTVGGGTVLSSTAGGGQPLASRSKDQVKNSEPIFNNKCSDAVKNASAWLDGVAVEPDVSPYSLKPEVFAFSLRETDTAVDAKNVGYSANDVNLERVGELILYSTAQDTATSRKISAYLMGKWLNALPDGFADFRRATVTGAGTLTAENDSYLPVLGEGFSGTVELTQDEWSFGLGRTSGETEGLVDLSGHGLSLPSRVTINLSVSHAAAGLHPLFRFGTFASDTEFVLGDVRGNGSVELVVEAGAVYAKYAKPGVLLLVR